MHNLCVLYYTVYCVGICKQCAVACIFGFLKQQLYNIDVLLQVSQSASDSILYHLGLPLPSAGFHVFPTFLMSEFTTICSATISVVILKLFIGVCVLGFFTGHCKSSTWGVAFSLAQVSEFSFVLASRARQLRIISREVCQSIVLLALLMTITYHIDDHYHVIPSPHTTPGLLGDPEHSSNESPTGTSPVENVSASVSASPRVSLLPLPRPQQATSQPHLQIQEQWLCQAKTTSALTEN